MCGGKREGGVMRKRRNAGATRQGKNTITPLCMWGKKCPCGGVQEGSSCGCFNRAPFVVGYTMFPYAADDKLCLRCTKGI
eukprot:1720916-Pyramimonas_sp.AAC.1